MDSYFYFDQTCSTEGIVLPRDVECLVHPVLMCNGIRNCDDCSDEVEENCRDSPCEYGELKRNINYKHQVLIINNVSIYSRI